MENILWAVGAIMLLFCGVGIRILLLKDGKLLFSTPAFLILSAITVYCNFRSKAAVKNQPRSG